MSHALTIIDRQGQFTPFLLTIIDYTTGGELIPSSEVGTDVIVVLFAPSNVNVANKVAFAALLSGRVFIFFQNAAGTLVEVPTTTGVNATFNGLVISHL
jgi:hypothetical protein